MRRPVVLIHGMWCHAELWSRVAAVLQDRGHECLIPTLPAHEPGTPPEEVGALSLKDYLAFLEDWLAQREFRTPPVLIGHSMGGLLAQQLAARTDPFALVLLTPAPPAGIFGLRWANFVSFFRVFLRWGWWRKPHKPSWGRAKASAFNDGVAPERMRDLYDSLVHESGRTVFEIGLWPLDRARAAAVDTSAVRCPVYVVSAGRDRLTPASVVRLTAARYPGSALRHYPSRGHWVLDDADTEEMATEIANWLQGQEHRAAARGRA